MEHKELLRKWLRGKGIHIADIKAALDWYESEVSEGRKPEDKDVLAKAEEYHKQAVDAPTGVPVQILEKEKVIPQIIPVPFLDLDKVQKIIFAFSFGGTAAALIVYEGIRWLLMG